MTNLKASMRAIEEYNAAKRALRVAKAFKSKIISISVSVTIIITVYGSILLYGAEYVRVLQ